eukprot:7285267-Lingulodinium_polyedra.AAC.1
MEPSKKPDLCGCWLLFSYHFLQVAPARKKAGQQTSKRANKTASKQLFFSFAWLFLFSRRIGL